MTDESHSYRCAECQRRPIKLCEYCQRGLCEVHRDCPNCDANRPEDIFEVIHKNRGETND